MIARTAFSAPTGAGQLNIFVQRCATEYPASRRARDLAALKRLAEHLGNGEWERRYGELLIMDELDIGYRLVVGRP
jgi:hypothetical protein